MELSDPLVAEELAKFNGRLTLPKVESFSDEAADAISGFKGEWLEIMGEFEISNAAASSLSKIFPHKLNIPFSVRSIIEEISE